ncbi:hypothetical protein ACFE04_015464 [Oxalis oulophora]
MSLTESSANRMALVMNGNNNINSNHIESFQKFFECWLVEQNQHLQELIISVSSQHNDQQQQLRPLINRVVQHYEQYYKAKSWWAGHNVLQMLTPTWRSSLEDAFLWIGGWRPTMAFHLLYSKSGIQFESSFSEMLRVLRSNEDLGDLSSTQLSRIDELHNKTVKEEREATEKMAEQQEKVADSTMVELSHKVTELMRNGREAVTSNGGNGGIIMGDEVNSCLNSKENGLREVLEKADDLRLRTLKGVIDVLNPIQAVHFLIAAAELHLRIHDWGKHKDDIAN